ncbi:hypothetical protein GCM10018781_69040 [Kitasatospora indigofera]|uniref:DUF2332 domain-containing protein n=1 Tax=Kitasatospora indigofera TaxID=67307 RepID=A0A919L3Y3_9ACTN|nr:DUF2332 domain-containing protein [Kitasatospora indigofera]GHH82977.1 hypothetical protein GCM10018781_69040 [Kitasatospora indigofera]
MTDEPSTGPSTGPGAGPAGRDPSRRPDGRPERQRDRQPFRSRTAELAGQQAAACERLGSPLYGALLRRVAEDVTAGGPCAEALAGHEDASDADALALRLLGGVHALVLTGRAPGLAAHYPSAGGRFDPLRPDAGWPAFRATVRDNLPWVRDWLTRPPQTNEVGRAVLLVTGLLRVLPAGLPVRLFELGASAGLNLLADRFRYTAGPFGHGPADSPVVLREAWQDAPPDWLRRAAGATPALAFAERHGCDLRPIDPASPEGALALRAYVWPDQPGRTARLAGALALAAKQPPDVRPIGAAAFLREVTVQPGALTVVWHSIMRQYVPEDEWAAVEQELTRLAESSSPAAPFAYLAFEPLRSGAGAGHRFVLTVRAGTGAPEVLAEAPPHGLPARPYEERRR